MFRAVLCILALEINTGVAFQALGRPTAARWSRTVALKANNNYGFTPMGEERQDRYEQTQGRYATPPRFGSKPLSEPQLSDRARMIQMNKQVRHAPSQPSRPWSLSAYLEPCAVPSLVPSRLLPAIALHRFRRCRHSRSCALPPRRPRQNLPCTCTTKVTTPPLAIRQRQQDFGTFSAAQTPAALPSIDELETQILVEKSKGPKEKDYNRLKQLTSQLQARQEFDASQLQAKEFFDAQVALLQAKLEAAEAAEDYDQCQELQAQLVGLETSGAVPYSTDQDTSSGLATYNDNNNGLAETPYDGPMPRGDDAYDGPMPRGYGAYSSWASLEADDGSDGDGKLVY